VLELFDEGKIVIVMSVGMQKAGSAWYFNITNDLLIAAGHQDIRVLRERFHLQNFMTKVNCNMGSLKTHKLVIVSLPHWLGNTYTIKTHDLLTPAALWMIKRGFMKATYIYRDPRDVAMSVFEHGERIRTKGIRSQAGFDLLTSIEEAIRFTSQLLLVWESWVQCGEALLVRYESLRRDALHEAERMVDFLELDLPKETISEVVERYDIKQVRKGLSPVDLHFYKGQTGRWKEAMTPSQKALCQDLFGKLLPRMGYDS